jgi:hypothetical protein
VLYRGVDIDALLGVSDVRLRPRYTLSPPTCLDEHGGIELGDFRGIDVKATHDAIRAGIAALTARAASRGGTLERIALDVGFVGAPPAGLPPRRLVVARWEAPDRFEGHVARIERAGVGRTKTIRLPSSLANTDVEVFVYQVGTETRRLGTGREKLQYTPWGTGAYWILACQPGADAGECFVIAATRQL